MGLLKKTSISSYVISQMGDYSSNNSTLLTVLILFFLTENATIATAFTENATIATASTENDTAFTDPLQYGGYTTLQL